MVDRLSKKGLVERQQCFGDRRLVDISLTEAGLELLRQMELKSCEFELCLSSLTHEEAESLNNLLNKVRANSKDNE